MKLSFAAGEPVVCSDKISRFCDGSAVTFVGNRTFELCYKNVDEIATVPDGRISTTVLDLYTQGIAVEPAGV
jgi:threonine dehydratase